jgi:hypothetical protein
VTHHYMRFVDIPPFLNFGVRRDLVVLLPEIAK